MSARASDAYLDTRVSLMIPRLLDAGAIARLAQLDLSALAHHLGLEALLDEQQSVRGRSRAIEQALIQLLLSELQVLIRPMRGAEHELLLAWGRKFALYNLKTLLRGKLHALDPQHIREQLFDLPELIRLPHQRLFGAENVEELLRLLEAGPYRQIARQAREVYAQRREPFALEAAIDQHYHISIAREAAACEGHHAAPLRALIGILFDRIDLLWLLRFRFCYGLAPSETFYHLIPSPGRLNRKRLLQLAELGSLEQVLAALPGALQEPLAECTNLAEVQRRLDQLSARAVEQVLHRSPSAMARALAYLIRREQDLSALFALLQGRLLGLSQSVIEIALDLAPPDCHWPRAA